MTSPARTQIYATPTCPFCISAKALLRKKGIRFDEIDLRAHPERRAEMMQRAAGRRTVPQIFIDGQHVGGCDDLFDLDRQGKLDAMLRGSAA